MTTLRWKAGFEIELLAPPGKSRLDLASRVATRCGGSVRRFFHAQAELTNVAGKPTFENLTPGFEVLDAGGAPVARFVDDLTLVSGLDADAAPLPGWYRIVSDDRRFISLMLRQCDPDAALARVLEPIAALFGSELDRHPSGMVKVSDERGASIAIGAVLSNERERGCEIVTPPFESDHEALLAALLADAVAEGFSIPAEGATHIHFDAAPLTSARVISRLVQVFLRHGEVLKQLVGVNPNCRRLGPWPEALLTLAASDDFKALEWPEARRALSETGLTKFCDFNLLNMISTNMSKHTFEVRVLPSLFDAAEIIRIACLFEAILNFCITDNMEHSSFGRGILPFIEELPLPNHDKTWWIARAGSTDRLAPA